MMISRKTSFEENMGHELKTVSSHSPGFGIVINLDRFFKTKYKNQRNSERTMISIEREAYISYRFSTHVVAYYTGFKGDALQSFIKKYIPSYAWLRQHTTNEDVLYYINEKLKEFRKYSRNHPTPAKYQPDSGLELQRHHYRQYSADL